MRLFLKGFRVLSRGVVRGTLLVASLGLVGAPVAYANPAGEQVVAGSASFSRSGSTLQINTSDRVIINWQGFSINAGELTKFVQPSSASAALNKVISGNPSSILGALQSNGRIYLINPNGIMVGAGATINCGAFIASTLDLANSEFLAGGDLRLVGNSAATIVNQGCISASGGDVFLIARQVENQGTILAPNGVAGLAAGNEVLLAESGSERLFVRPTASDGSWTVNGIRNAGVLEGAQAELKAHGNIYAFAINNEGVVRANGVDLRDGRVLLTAEDGLVKNTGTIAAGSPSGLGGNSVAIQALSIQNNGQVTASGLKGGSVSLRADYIDQSGTVAADGTTGDGGNVQLQANLRVLLPSAGVISANGAGAGDGGKVEVTSGGTMILSGKIEATSEAGVGGAIHLTAPRFALAAAEVDASGGAGGGEILVGGGPQGDGTILGSSLTVVNPYTTIRADATVAGNGGNVVVWSDGATDFEGKISVRGGPGGGNGGTAEVSGKESLVFLGNVDATAPLGQNGSLLLDPKNVTIANVTFEPITLAFTFLDPSSSPSSNDGFGRSVSSMGTQILVGSPGDSSSGTSQSGAAYVFDGLTGSLDLTLANPLETANGLFGFSVLGVGGRYAVSAPGNMYGEVYLFDDTGTLQTTMMNPSGMPGDQFGFSLALIPIDRFAVGAPNTSVGGFLGAGKVYIYGAGGGTLLQPIANPTPNSGDRFGHALAASVESLYIGAPYATDAGIAGAGLAYVYNYDTGGGSFNYTRTLHGPSPAAADNFGYAVGSMGGGPVVGAPGRTVGGFAQAGSAYVFNGGSDTLRMTLDNPEPGVGDEFGSAIAPDSESSGALAIGAPFHQVGGVASGSVYIFDSSESGFGTLENIVRNPTPAANDKFGASLARYNPEGDLIIGSPHGGANGYGVVHVYDDHQGRAVYNAAPQISLIEPTPGAFNEFGASVATIDGYALVGVPGDPGSGHPAAGAVYVFDGTTGALAATLLNPTPEDDDHFGKSVTGGGGFVVVGAPDKFVTTDRPGQAFVFSSSDGSLVATLDSQNPEDGGRFGFAVDVGQWNASVVVGAPDETGGGKAYLFDASSGNWQQTLANPGEGADGFGWSVAGGSGSRLVVGAPFDSGTGAAYVYLPWNGELVQTVNGSGTGALFGTSVGSRNSTFFVGAPGDVGGMGTVSVFDSSTGVLEFLFNNPSPSTGGGFGTSLSAVRGSHLLVGAPGGPTDAGAAHLYRLGDGSLMATFNNPGSAGDAFGQSVALFNDENNGAGTDSLQETVLIGAEQKAQGAATAAGGAYLFQPSSVGIRFSDDPGQDTVLATSKLVSMLSGGLNLFLQANNDITIQDVITVNNESGNGGSMKLQAGRSVLINADITSDNGAVTIVANETLANGVNSAYRGSGNAVITMKEGTTLDAGTANVSLTLSDGAGLTYSQSGNITLANINAGNVLVVNNGPTYGSSVRRTVAGESADPLITVNGAAFQVTSTGGSVGTAGEPIRMSVANLDVKAPSGGAFFSLPSGGVILGGSAPGGTLGMNGLDSPGSFNLTAAGDVTSAAGALFNVLGTVTIDTGSSDLTLGNSTAFFGEINLSGRDVSVTQSGTAIFGDSTITGNLLVEAAGVSQTAATTMIVDGSAGFTISGAATLDNTGNGFTGPVSFTDASSVSFHNSRATDLGATSVGSLSVVSVGSITDSGTLAIASGATFDSGTDDITLDDASSTFGSLNLTGANLLVKENSAMSFSGVDASGDFSAESTGTIGQAMGISVTGDASFKAGGDITLLYSANTFGGAVSFDAAGHAVQLNTGVAPLDLGTSAAASLTIHANGPLTDSGDLTISGAAVFDIGSAYDITLDRSGSTFGSVSLTANNATLRENDATDLASVSVMGTLDVQSGGVITDSGMLMVGAAASFDAGSSDITLDNATSSFGSVLLSGANATVQRNGPVVLGASTLTGNLAVGAGAGNISQVGSVSVGGTASFSSGNTVTLGDTGNDFQGAVSFSSGGASSLTSIGPVVLGASTVGGNLDVTAGGAITQTGILVVDGTWATFTAGSGNDITLGNPANDFVGVQIGSGKDVKVVDANNLVIGTSLVSGNFEVTAGGPITQSGVITANGNGTTALLTAGPANSITLSNPLNDWNTVRIVSANNVLLADANAVDLGASTVSGTLDVSAGGVIVQSGALDIMGNASFGTTGNYISLLNVGNKFSGQLSFSGTASVGGYVEAVNSVATTLGGFSVMGDFSLVSNGAITQAGAMNIPSEAFFDATGNNITLGSGMNTFGSLLLNGANVTVSEYNATILDGVIATGTFNLTSNGAVSQTGPMGAHLLTVSAMGAIDLADSGNQIGILGNMSSSGAVDVYDSTGGLSVQGAVSGGSSAGNTVTIRTAGGNLALDVGASILASPGNDIRFVTDQSFVNNVGAGVLSMSGGGRFLAYAGSSAVNVLNGLISSFTEYGVTWPTAPLAVNIGNGELFSYAPPPPPPPPDNTDQIIQDVNNALNPTETIPGTGGPTLFALLGGDTGGTGGTGGIGGTGDGGGTGGGTGGTGDGTLAGGSSLGGGTGGTTGGTTDPGGDKASVPAGGGMRMGAQGLNSTGFQQVPQTLQRAISLQIRNQLQGAIGNF